jgi:hypothetical protein
MDERSPPDASSPRDALAGLALALKAAPPSDNVRFANAEAAVLAVEGGCGSRGTLSTNGLCPALLDNRTLLLLPRSNMCMLF